MRARRYALRVYDVVRARSNGAPFVCGNNLYRVTPASARAARTAVGRRDGAAGSRDKRFVVVPGARHNDVSYGNTPAGNAIAAFLAAR